MKRRATALPNRQSSQQAFLAHLHELRKRLYIIAASVVFGGSIAYLLDDRLLDFLLKPAGGQQFIYTSPMGGMNFLFNVCIYMGLIASIPVIVLQILRFIEPTLPRQSRHFVSKIAAASAVLALIGIAFGYYVGLPNALHFLLNQFVTQQVKPLVTIQSYMSFVGMYMFGSALLLQAPLLLLFIDHIKPLKPKKLLGLTRWVVLLSFIGAFIINPTPNVIAQATVAVPIILSYYIGVLIIHIKRIRSGLPRHVVVLSESDKLAQSRRLAQASVLKPIVEEAPVAIKPIVRAARQPRPSSHSRYATLHNRQPAKRQLVM